MTRLELLAQVINARLAVSQVIGSIEANPILRNLRDPNGSPYLGRLEVIYLQLAELQASITTQLK